MSWKIRFLMATDTARGMLYLHHRAGVIQRDLKTANLLIAEGFHIKIADFGLSRKPRRLLRTGAKRPAPLERVISFDRQKVALGVLGAWEFSFGSCI